MVCAASPAPIIAVAPIVTKVAPTVIATACLCLTPSSGFGGVGLYNGIAVTIGNWLWAGAIRLEIGEL